MSSPSLQATLRQSFFLFISTPQESHLHLTPYLNFTSPSANARSPGDHSSGGAPLHQRFRREENPCTHRPLTCRTGKLHHSDIRGTGPSHVFPWSLLRLPSFLFHFFNLCFLHVPASTSHPPHPYFYPPPPPPLSFYAAHPTYLSSIFTPWIHLPSVPYTPTLTLTNFLWHVTFYYLSVLRNFQSLPEMLETVDIACMVNILAKQVSYVLSINPFHERLFPFPFTWLGQHLLV